MNEDPAARTRARRAIERAGRATVDQVLSSGTGLLLVVLVARADDAATFGAVSVALIVNGFVLGTGRAAVGEVVLMRCRGGRTDTRREAEVGLCLSLGLGAAGGLVVVVAGTLVGGEVGAFLQLVAVAAPFVLAQDVLRYVAYGRARIGQAILLDGTWLGVQAVASVVLIVTDQVTATRLVVAWLAGAALSATAGCLIERVRPHRQGVRAWWRSERVRAAGFVSDFVVSTGMVQASFVLLGVLLPLDEFGALRAAFVSLSPLANLLAGVRTLTLAQLAGLRTAPARARRQAALFATAFAASGAVYGAALVVLPDRLGAEVFGETWTEAASLVGIVAVGEVLRLSTFAAIDLTKVLGSSLALVRTRATAAVGVIVGLLGGAALTGPKGAAVGAALGYAGASGLWWHRARQVVRDPQQLPVERS